MLPEYSKSSCNCNMKHALKIMFLAFSIQRIYLGLSVDLWLCNVWQLFKMRFHHSNQCRPNVNRCPSSSSSQSAVPAKFLKRSKLVRERDFWQNYCWNHLHRCRRLTAIGANWRFLTKFWLKNFLRNSVKSLNWKVSSVPLFCLFQLPSCIFNRWAKIQSNFCSFILLDCSKYLN